MDTQAIKAQIKQLMVENLMLQVAAGDIGDDQALFGPNSLGLDSVDALQLVVMLDKHFGLKIADPETARRVLQNINTMTEAVLQNRGASTGSAGPPA
ncbi:MAG: acyl carrier protein [Verrucomicrobiae bacterium]|nr:acyl carrier protein [Verrucomicrobiae bacterium]